MRWLIAIALLIYVNEGVAQETITECTGLVGKTYHLPGFAVSESESGWRDDGIKDGRFILSEKDGKPIVRFESGNQSVTSEGGGALAVYLSSNVVAVLYPGTGTAEIYLFKLDETGAGYVLYSKTKSNMFFDTARVFVGVCAPPGTFR